MSHEKKSNFLTKISPLIEGQVPDFVQADHPLFVDFLKDYYQFLEAGKLEVNVTTDYIRLETTTSEYILLEDGERVIDESFTGKFTDGETITGGTSSATATILVEDSRNSVLYVSSQQKFITEELITGGTSGSSAKIIKYRANPVQNIQQLLDYADVDNTIHDFFDQMRDSFMESIPSTLATNTSKRNLLKNIRDLYSAKGTSEGHKLFMRLLLGEDANIIYPTEYMMRPSDGNWRENQIIRATAGSGMSGDEVVGEKITGQTSGATANVKEALTIQQGTMSVTEFQIQNVIGTFVTGEVIKGRSTSRDVDVSFTLASILAGGTITNDGILHDVDETITVEAIGNEYAEATIDVIKSGGVSGVVVDDAGSGYQVGDTLTFTNPTADSDTIVATGFVAVVGGGITQEAGTLDDSDVTTDTIIIESDSNFTEESMDIILETKGVDFFVGNGSSTVFKLNNTSTLTDTLTLYLDDVKTSQLAPNGDSVWSIESTPYLVLNATDSSSTDAGDNILLEVDDAPQTDSVFTLEQQEITFTESPVDYTPAAGVQIRVRGDVVNYILLDGTDGSSFTNAGSRLLTNQTATTIDSYKTSTDQIVLEESIFSTAGEIQKVIVTNSGRGYTDLPTVSVTSVNGSGAALLATTDDIGAIDSIKVKEPGLNYVSSNPPDLDPRAHFVVKDVTGTFASGNTLTTHEGTVKGWDSSTQILDVAAFENVVRIDGEESGTFNQGIQLERGNTTGSLNTLLLEDVHTHDSDRYLCINGTGSTTRGPRIIRKKVTVVENTLNTIAESTADASLGEKIFAINSVYEPSDFTALRLEFFKGDTHYFDLSDSSLYNLDSTKNHQMAFAVLAERFEGDGSTASFTLSNPVETTPIAFITTDSSSFENNVRVHANANNTSYTASGNTLTFTTIPSSGTHIIVFTKYTTGVTTSSSDIMIGGGYYDLDGDGIVDEGAYIQIETTTETPNLYYYCVNHGPRMGYTVSTKTVETSLYDVGSNLLINAESIGSKPQGILLENGSQGTTLTTSHPGTFDVLLETDHNVLISSELNDYRTTLDNLVKSGKAVKKSDGTLDFSQKVFFENGKDFIVLNGTTSGSQDAGDSILFEDALNQEDRDFHLNNAYTQFLVKEDHDHTDFGDAGGTGVLTQEISDITEYIRFGLGTADTNVENIILETGTESFGVTKADGTVRNAFLLTEELIVVKTFTSSENIFSLEDAFIDLQHVNFGVLLESFESSSGDQILLDGTDSISQDAGAKILAEDSVVQEARIILNGTDSDSSNVGDQLLEEDETGFDEITLDGSDSSSTDATDNLILETAIDFSNNDVVITDSGGATATIVKADIATVTSSVEVSTTLTGQYAGIESLLGENLNRIQDSWYYQDFSYEIVVGQSLLTYLSELKKAVHPVGFLPFGKVSIATAVSAAVTTTAAGVSEFTGDDTFSPILASVLETLFSQTIQSRLQTAPTTSGLGQRDDQIMLENGIVDGDNIVLNIESIVLNGTDSDSSNAGDEVLLETEGFIRLEQEQDIGSKILLEPRVIILNGTDSSSTNAGDQILLETGSFIVLEEETSYDLKLILNGTDSDSSNAGDEVLLETGSSVILQESRLSEFVLEAGELNAILYEADIVKSDTTNYAYDGGGRVMSESSHAPSADADRVLVREITTKISARPNSRTSRNLLLYLANDPFGDVDSVQLESGIGNESDHLVLDGTLPFQYPDAFFRMEGTSGVDNLILNGTDSSSTNAGGDILLESGHKIQLENSTYVNISETERILLESSYEGTGRLKTEASPWSYPSGFLVNENDRIVFENENEFVETIPLSEIGSFRFEDIRRTDKIILDNNSVDQDNTNAAENTGILMENFGQLLLDGTDSSSTNAGSFVAQETTKNNKFTLEESGSLIVENNSTHSVVEFLAAESANDEILLEDVHRPLTAFGIQLEQDSYNQDVIILDGMDSDSLYAGLPLELEDIFQVVGTPHIVLESTNIIQSEGQIPLDNWTLNSSTSPIGYQPVVHASEIRVRTTGDIALEDSTDTTYGYLVLNGTDGSSTNAGDNLDCEGATGIAG